MGPLLTLPPNPPAGAHLLTQPLKIFFFVISASLNPENRLMFLEPRLWFLFLKLLEPTFVTLPTPQKNFVNIFFVFAWEICLNRWRGFLVNFFWSPSPTKRSTKSPRKTRENSGQNSGRKFEIFGKLSFCNFSGLTFEHHSFRNL